MRSLFGGAIECELPATYEDVSLLRDTPDNEEVLFEGQTDSCIIIELLEYKDDVPDNQIAAFHFNNIAEENEVQSAHIQETAIVDRASENFQRFHCCSGVQSGIVKFREQDPIGNDIFVCLAVARIKELNVEIVISLSAPLSLSSESSSYKLGSIPNVERGKQIFQTVLSSFRIVDYGIFA